MMTKHEQNQGSSKCSHAVLNSFFMAISNTTIYNINAIDVNDLTEDMISKTLQLLNKIEFQVCKDQKTITLMKLIHADHEDLKEMSTS